jgi:hypothetical protein
MCKIHKLRLVEIWVLSIVTCYAMNVIESNNNNRTIFANSNESNNKNNNSNNDSLHGKGCVCLKTIDGFHYVNDPRV